MHEGLMMRVLVLLAILLTPLVSVAQQDFPSSPTGIEVQKMIVDARIVTTPTGAYADVQKQRCFITTSAGLTTAVTFSPCSFTTADVGKRVVVTGAGPSNIGYISGVAVASPGSGYLSVPVATASGGNVQVSPDASVWTLSAVVKTGGTGCTEGAQTFTLTGGTFAYPAQVSGTVTGGVLGGTLTSVTGGRYTFPPNPDTDVLATGGGCATAPVLTATMAFNSIYVGGFDVAMGVESAIVSSGGSGCSTGAQTFTASGGSETDGAVITGTVSGGALSGALIISAGGYYDGTLPTTLTLTGGGCAVAPVASVSWGVAAITPNKSVEAPVGSTTVALSDVGAGTPATVGAVTVTGLIHPLATTITAASNVGGTYTVTFADAALTSTSSFQSVYWGHDDAAAINAAITNAPDQSTLWFPPPVNTDGCYGVASGIALPGNKRLALRGSGLSCIIAMAPMQALVTRDGSSEIATRGTEIEGIKWNANALAQIGFSLNNPREYHISHGRIENALYVDYVCGIGSPGKCYEIYLSDMNISTDSTHSYFVQSPKTLPLYNMLDEGLASDNWYGPNIAPYDAQFANVIDLTGGYNHWTNIHVYGYASPPAGYTTYYPEFGYYTVAQTLMESVQSDGASVAGIYIGGVAGFGVHIHGGLVQWGGTNACGSAMGVAMIPGAYYVSIEGVQVTCTTADRKIVQLGGGSVDQRSTINGNSGAALSTPVAGNGIIFCPDGTCSATVNNAFVAGRLGAKATAQDCIVMGGGGLCDGAGSIALGVGNTGKRAGCVVYSNRIPSPPPALPFALPDPQFGICLLWNNNEAVSDKSTPMRATSSSGAANTSNCLNISFLRQFSFGLRLIAMDITNENNSFSYFEPMAIMIRPVGGVVGFTPSGTAIAKGIGAAGWMGLTASSVSVTADTTNGCLNVTFTPPVGNTDTVHITARVDTIEVQ